MHQQYNSITVSYQKYNITVYTNITALTKKCCIYDQCDSKITTIPKHITPISKCVTTSQLEIISQYITQLQHNNVLAHNNINITISQYKNITVYSNITV